MRKRIIAHSVFYNDLVKSEVVLYKDVLFIVLEYMLPITRKAFLKSFF